MVWLVCRLSLWLHQFLFRIAHIDVFPNNSADGSSVVINYIWEWKIMFKLKPTNEKQNTVTIKSSQTTLHNYTCKIHNIWWYINIFLASRFWDSGHKKSCQQAPAWLQKIVTLSQLDRLWPIYRRATLLSNGPSTFFMLPPPLHSWHFLLLFINSLLGFFSQLTSFFFTSVSIYYNISDSLLVVTMIKIAFQTSRVLVESAPCWDVTQVAASDCIPKAH